MSAEHSLPGNAEVSGPERQQTDVRTGLLYILGRPWAAWLLALLVAVVRSPLLLWHGRVMAEEGTVYLQQAWTARPLVTLLAVHQGYFSLLMNLLALLGARGLPLAWYGNLMTVTALAVMMLTVFLAIECELFPSPAARLLAAAVVVLTPSIEVWMTAEDAQFMLALATALVCLSHADRHRWLRTLTLVLSALTGPVSCVLTPFFWVRAWRQRTRWAVLQAGLMTLASLAMAVVLLASLRGGSRGLAGRGKIAWFGPVLVIKIFSVEFFTRLGAFACQKLLIPHQNLPVFVIFWLLTAGFLGLFWRMACLGGQEGRLCFWMALSSLGFNYMGIAESLQVIFIGAFRYFFTGFALFSLVLVIAYARTREAGTAQARTWATRLVLLAMLTSGIDAAGYWGRFQRIAFDWREQVSQWQQDPRRPIHVSPITWTNPVRLAPDHSTLPQDRR